MSAIFALNGCGLDADAAVEQETDPTCSAELCPTSVAVVPLLVHSAAVLMKSGRQHDACLARTHAKRELASCARGRSYVLARMPRNFGSSKEVFEPKVREVEEVEEVRTAPNGHRPCAAATTIPSTIKLL